MTFRTEEKLFIDRDQIIEFRQWMQTNGAETLYPSREIESLYFDNTKSQMYRDSEEGCMPRKKIRIRKYPAQNIGYSNLEIKISAIEGRFKKSKKISNKDFKRMIVEGYIDHQYGPCMPKLIINYSREYYKICNDRITIDYNIQYRDEYETLRSFQKENMISVEIKSNFKRSKNELLNVFPFQRIRFSKYCRAYKSLFLN